jgi:hypothetical protein
MENYIIRIYQRNDKDAEQVAGQVEVVGQEKVQVFHNFEELKVILSTHKTGASYKFRAD